MEKTLLAIIAPNIPKKHYGYLGNAFCDCPPLFDGVLLKLFSLQDLLILPLATINNIVHLPWKVLKIKCISTNQ